MTDIDRSLSPEDKAQYDALMHEAGYTSDGQQRPSHEIKDKCEELLRKAVRDGKTWATYVLDADARDGHLKRFKRWDRQRQVVATRFGERVVKKSAVMSLKRRDDVGRLFYQGTFWDDMNAQDLMDIIGDATVRIESNRDLIATARRLLDLLEKTGMPTVSLALERLGMELEEYLTGEAA